MATTRAAPPLRRPQAAARVAAYFDDDDDCFDCDEDYDWCSTPCRTPCGPCDPCDPCDRRRRVVYDPQCPPCGFRPPCDPCNDGRRGCSLNTLRRDCGYPPSCFPSTVCVSVPNWVEPCSSLYGCGPYSYGYGYGFNYNRFGYGYGTGSCFAPVVAAPALLPSTTSVGTATDTVCNLNGCYSVSQPTVTSCNLFGCSTAALGPPNLTSVSDVPCSRYF